MFIEYMNYELSKTPTTLMTEDIFNDTGISFSLNAKYNTIVAFLKTQFNALLKENYSIEIDRMNELSSERIIDSLSENNHDSFIFVFRSIHLKDKSISGEIRLSGTFVTKFEIDNVYEYDEMYKNMLESHKETGIVAVSDKDQSVEGTSLVIGHQADEFMKTMNTKFMRKKGEK